MSFLRYITDNRVDEITDETKSQFLSEYGAEPFTSTDQLEYALGVLYNQRVELGLENPSTVVSPPFADTDTCSIETQNAAVYLLEEIHGGLNFSSNFFNMEQYLKNIQWTINFDKPLPTPVYVNYGRRRGNF